MDPVRPVASPLLVGRDDVLRLAERRLAEAASGRGQSLLVAGDAGIGKSRLIAAVVRRAEANGFRAAKGDLSPHDRQVPLGSVLDLARTLSRHRAFGHLGSDLLTLERHRGADRLGHRRFLVHDVADAIIASVDAPTLLAFDDLQWGDELSLEVVGELARRGRDLPLLVIAGYRLGELPVASIQREWRARLLSQRLAEEVRLGPLTEDETALVTTLILGTGLPAPRDVAQAIYERTDGIPLHIEELLAALAERQRHDGRAIRDARVPDTIEDAILSRYRRLSPDAQVVARAGAVIGRCFVPEVLAGLLDRPAADLDRPLGELVEQSFLYPFSFLDRGYYDFRHQLLRDALYGTVQAGELRRLHARAGEFGGLNDGSAEIHASVHFERAGLRPQAYRAALAGARAASSVSSRREAYELLARAVANVPDDLPDVERADLHLQHAIAASAVDDTAVMTAASLRAREHFRAAGDDLRAAEALLLVAEAGAREAQPPAELETVLAAVQAELDSLPPSGTRSLLLSDVHLFRALSQLDGPDIVEAAASLQACRLALDEIDLSFAADSPDVPAYRLELEFWEAELDVLAGRVEAGLRATLDVAREARDARLESTGVTAFRNAAALGVRVLDYASARVGLDEGLRYADEIEQSYCRHVMASTTAAVHWADGRWDEARAIAEIELVEPGSRRGTLPAVHALAFVLFGRGELDRARELLETSLAAGLESGAVSLVLPPRWGLAEVALLAGSPDAAFQQCEAALNATEVTGERALLIPFVVTGTRAALASRRPDEADRWLERLSALLAAWRPRAGPALDHATGLVRTAAGSTVSARVALEAAIVGWDRLGRTWEGQWARLDLAACLLRGNRDAWAVAVLREVQANAETLASAPLRRRAEGLLAVARGRGAEEEPWRPLTTREFEVARLVADGKTNGEIGEALGLSPRTVGAHVEHILAKLGFTRRAEVAAWVATLTTARAAAG